jgi:hypothetical protein
MAKSPTDKSAQTSGAAKDDVVGAHNDFTFTIHDLLANDPGGALKSGIIGDAPGSQFFFGSTAADQHDQKGYLEAHGIIDNHDGTYTLKSGSDTLDFDYFVQIGNKGTWSQAHVDVVDRPDAPPPVVHHGDGDLLFLENFDTYASSGNLSHGSWGEVNLGIGSLQPDGTNHGWAIDQGGQWASVSGEIAQTSPDNFWLDTQNSPGGIDMTNWFVDPTGGDFHLSFELGIRDFGSGPKMETDPSAVLKVLVDNKEVGSVSYQNVLSKAGTDHMAHFDFTYDGNGSAATPTGHNISFVDATPPTDGGNYVGFMLDNIQVHDWLVV